MKIFAGRASILGDVIMALPLLNVLYKMYDYPLIDVPLAPKCKQIAPLLLFQDKINKIVQTEDNERLFPNEFQLLTEQYNKVINCFPNHPREQDWFNYRDCVSESILMAGEEYYEVFKSLPKELQKPHLNPWWLQDELKYHKERKRIAIFPFAGYSQGLQRSPSVEWWKKLIKELGDNNYFIHHFGHFNEPYLSPEPEWFDNDFELCYYKYECNLPLFTQIQLAYECDLVIGTDSGSMHIMGALGVINQINLLTMWENGHNKNPLALAPPNYNGNEINLFAENGCSNIPIEKVLELIK